MIAAFAYANHHLASLASLLKEWRAESNFAAYKILGNFASLSKVKISFNMESLKFWFREDNSTGFGYFSDYCFWLLDVVGFNVLHKFSVGTLNHVRNIFLVVLIVVGSISSFSVVCRYTFNIEEVIMGIITCIMTFQVLCKMIELIVHRKDHLEMMKTVESNTKALEQDLKHRHVGVRNFMRAKKYIFLASFAYVSALASLTFYPLYPLLTRGEYKLAANTEVPGTNFKTPTGWLINYIFGVSIAFCGCILIIGEESSRNFPVKTFRSFSQPTTPSSSFTCSTSLGALKSSKRCLRWLETSTVLTSQKKSSTSSSLCAQISKRRRSGENFSFPQTSRACRIIEVFSFACKASSENARSCSRWFICSSL